jgi:SAM-dependent methyltransferase
MLEVLIPRYGIAFNSAADLGCGTGLFARYLRRRWRVPVFAVDRSPQMLLAAIANGSARDVCLLLQDIRGLHLPHRVDLITANFDTINHLLRQDDLECAFRRVFDNLRPGGYFIFDVLTDRQPLRPLQVYARRVRDIGRRIVQRVRWLPWNRMLLMSVTISEHGRRCPDAEVHIERTYAPAFIAALLEGAGFRIRALLDANDLQTAYRNSPRVVFVARKPICAPHESGGQERGP